MKITVEYKNLETEIFDANEISVNGYVVDIYLPKKVIRPPTPHPIYFIGLYLTDIKEIRIINEQG